MSTTDKTKNPIEVVDIEIEKLKTRYLTAMHGVQSGIAMLIKRGDTLAEPKHLRVGIDSAHVSDSALVQLLIAKGVITELEYHESLVKAAEEERGRLEEKLTEVLGQKVTLL